jgi:imidazoleglycerol phosphate synthase glutamine amidotransferase subunit HisH
LNVTLIDSPVANVANIARALRAAGADLRVTRDSGAIASARKLVLPGVGSFVAAMRWLE